MSAMSQRDAFWTAIYELAKRDRDVVVVSADMGAPALDRFRTDLPGQFINVGISEQHALLLGAGMALEGKKPFIYAIAPFITLRCLEQTRVAGGIMNIPLTLVGVGTGFGYDDSGPTHHLIEDIAVMRAFPHVTIHSISDSNMAGSVAKICSMASGANYVRLERQSFPDIYRPGVDFSKGFTALRNGEGAWLLATGLMVHTALKISDELRGKKKHPGVIDVYRIPTDERALVREIRSAKRIFTLEEHFLAGGFGSYVLELLNKNGMTTPVQRIGIPIEKGYCYAYGGRRRIHEYYGIDYNDVKASVMKCL